MLSPSADTRCRQILIPAFGLDRRTLFIELNYKSRVIEQYCILCRLTYSPQQSKHRVFSAAETEPHEGKRKVESLWPIFRIHHQKTRYIFDLFYKRKAISRELYEYCIKEGYADKNLIAKWKKQGYENLCCLRCIQTRDTNFGTNCICRVPKSKLEVGRIIECTHCGCRGCSG
nr:protein BUD31 homolog [Odocoileus virginianus texanus]